MEIDQCEYVGEYQGHDNSVMCYDLFNCCNCGGNGCCCNGCFSCNACRYCLADSAN